MSKALNFNKENKPADAADRCVDCKIEQQCPYSAVRQYLEPVKLGCPNWTSFVAADIPDIENITSQGGQSYRTNTQKYELNDKM